MPVTKICDFIKTRSVVFAAKLVDGNDLTITPSFGTLSPRRERISFLLFFSRMSGFCAVRTALADRSVDVSSCLTGHHHHHLHRRQAEGFHFCPTRTLSVDKSIFLSTVHYDRFIPFFSHGSQQLYRPDCPHLVKAAALHRSLCYS